MKKILLTGFEPFSDIKNNPSETLVFDLSRRLKFEKDLHTDVYILPVDYQKAAVYVESLDISQYDFIFQFGVASSRTKISLERVALNWMESSIPDNSGRNPSPQKITDSGVEALFSSLDLATLSRHLNRQFGSVVDVSFSAGAYLCNYVYYKTLAKAPRCLFVHIPLTLNFNEQELSSDQKSYQDTLSTIGLELIGAILKR